MPAYDLTAPYSPKGDQPTAIKQLVAGVNGGQRYQTLLGATGTGKTFTMANVIAQTGRPALVLAHNKTLAAQLCNELRSCAASVLLWASTRAGLPVLAITFAIVKVLPVPVAPSRV